MAGNQETLRATKDYPDTLIPVGSVNPLTFWDSDDLVKQLFQYSFGIVRFFPTEQGWPIDFEPFRYLLQLLSKIPKPIADQSIQLPKATRGWKQWTDSGVPVIISIGKPGDATQLLRLISDYPAPIVLCGVTHETLIESLYVLKQNEQVLIETHRLTGPDSLEKVRDAVGADRLVFGSGGSALSIKAAVDHVRKSDFNQTELDAVFSGNASSILQGGH
jgi:predicted TIM-barrel fold metal-dependent hydrolase